MFVFVIGGVAVPPDDQSAPEQRDQLAVTCRALGRQVSEAGHVLLVCSPFEHSADYEVLSGVAEHAERTSSTRVDIHYPDHPTVSSLLPAWKKRLHPAILNQVPHSPLDVADKGPRSYSHAWLLSQLEALEQCSVVIAVGGRDDGTAGMLLRLAESRSSKPVLPLAFLGGAARASFLRRRYQLQDALGDQSGEELLVEPNVRTVIEYAERLIQPKPSGSQLNASAQRKFFISYARARPAEADYIEMILRRRNQLVLRDERDIEPGHDIPERLKEFLHSANVFIAVWCKEYACSPWCWDELEMALERQGRGTMELWLLCVDDTRIVPRGARNLNFYRVTRREELEGRMACLLDRR